LSDFEKERTHYISSPPGAKMAAVAAHALRVLLCGLCRFRWLRPSTPELQQRACAIYHV